jgi:hypothetical protein
MDITSLAYEISYTKRSFIMKKDQIKEILGKLGKATLPAIMLLSGAWKGNFTALSASELGIRAREQDKKKPPVEIQINDSEGDFSKELAQYRCGSCTGTCSGDCRGSCYWGCSTSCSGSCTNCTGTCTNTCSFTCMGTCSDSCLSYF